MREWFVSSIFGNDANSGTSWAQAKRTTLSLVPSIDVPQDDYVYVDKQHMETVSSGDYFGQWGFGAAVTLTGQQRMLCVDPATMQQTTGAMIVVNGSGNIIWDCTAMYVYGITFVWGAGTTGSPLFYLCHDPGSVVRFERCSFQSFATGGGGIRLPGDDAMTGLLGTSAGTFEARDCTFAFAAPNAGIRLDPGTTVHLDGGSLLPSHQGRNLFRMTGCGAFLVERFDMSAAPANMSIVQAGICAGSGKVQNSILPANWVGGVCDGVPMAGGRYGIYRCS